MDLVNLRIKVDKLSKQIDALDKQLYFARKALFSEEKLQNDDVAVKLYKGFPSYSSLLAIFEYLERKLQHPSYWRGAKSANTT